MERNSLLERLGKIDAHAAKRLLEIKDAIDKDDFSALAAIDVYGAIDPAGVEVRATEQIPGLWSFSNTFISVLEWFRNFLILLPITITWISFWLASMDYAAAIKTRPNLINSSFLYLWETGFEGAVNPRGPSFSQTAFAAAGILAVILLMTVVVHFWKDIQSNFTARQAANLRQDLERELWEIEKKLSEKRNQQSEKGTLEEISKTVAQFKETSEHLGESVDQFQTKANEAIAVTEALDVKIGALVNAKNGEVDDLTEFNRGLRGTVKQLVDQTKEASRIYQELQGSIMELASSTTKTSQAQDRLLERVSFVDTNLKNLAVETQSLAKTVQGAVTELHTTTQGNADLIRSGAATVTQFTDLFSGQVDLRKILGDTHKRLEEIARGLESSIKVMKELPTQIEAPVVQLANEATELRKSTTEISSKQAGALQDITTRLKNEISASIRESVSHLQNEIASLNQVTNRQVNALQSIAEDVGQASNTFLDRANELTQTMQDLNKDRRQIVFPWWQFALATGFSIFISTCLVATIVLGVVRLTLPGGLPVSSNSQQSPASNLPVEIIPTTVVQPTIQVNPVVTITPTPTTIKTVSPTPSARPTPIPSVQIMPTPGR